MKKILLLLQMASSILFLSALVSCAGNKSEASKELIKQISLKRGTVISCATEGEQFGSVSFEVSGSETVKKDFNLAVKMLHSFEYNEAEKVFAKIIDEEPECAMAYWGVAMCNYHPVWDPPSETELKKGTKVIEIAKGIRQKTKRESDYIDAISTFYQDWGKTGHRERSLSYEKAMEKLYSGYPKDKDAAAFYALALVASADPGDKYYANQKKAGDILNALYPDEPNHPGIAHYLIHTYDYPELAALALPAARKYASIAPSSAHALHMPSHIFTRLGLWDECIYSNLVSVSSAQCYAEAAGIKGHWDEELHGLDYLVYAYLQKGENQLAKKQWDYLKTIAEVSPANFKVAYAFAAIPSRYLLENKSWDEAAKLEVNPANFSWNDFPWQEAIIHFTRLIGSFHTGNTDSVKAGFKKLSQLYETLIKQHDPYKASQVQIQAKTAEAFVKFTEGKTAEAILLMNSAADMEDKTEKHPVTPGEVIPARELLAEMLLQTNKPAEALEAYEADLKKNPNRFNALYGAGMAAEKAGNPEKAGFYYRQLLTIAGAGNTARPELTKIKAFLKKHS